MNFPKRILLLPALLGVTALLSGCPGMPGTSGSNQDSVPPGVKPPPGLESGGVRTLMGTTITPPDNAILLVEYVVAGGEAEPEWRSCRRVTVLDDCLLIEGVNYDGRMEEADEDFNVVVPSSEVESFRWKYEPRPTPPTEEESGGEDKGD